MPVWIPIAIAAAAAVASTTYTIVASEQAKDLQKANSEKALSIQEKAVNAAIKESKTQTEIDLANAFAGVEALEAQLRAAATPAAVATTPPGNSQFPVLPIMALAGLGIVAVMARKR